jgi:hypothetical protein
MSKRQPYVKPVRFPHEIISEIFTYEDKEIFIKALITKQKTGAEWDNIRVKLPDAFLDKLKTVLSECWQNGFCRPVVRNGELIWYQLQGKEYKYQEQCDLCRKSFVAGDCKGKVFYNLQGNRKFKKCWERI